MELFHSYSRLHGMEQSLILSSLCQALHKTPPHDVPSAASCPSFPSAFNLLSVTLLLWFPPVAVFTAFLQILQNVVLQTVLTTSQNKSMRREAVGVPYVSQTAVKNSNKKS